MGSSESARALVASGGATALGSQRSLELPGMDSLGNIREGDVSELIAIRAPTLIDFFQGIIRAMQGYHNLDQFMTFSRRKSVEMRTGGLSSGLGQCRHSCR